MLLAALEESVSRYATLPQLLGTAPYYSSGAALELVLSHDGDVAWAAREFHVEREMLQAVLFQEIRFLNVFDEVDWFVSASYDYLQRLDDCRRGRLRVPVPPPLVFRTDSSTGLGQIFASTAIAAINWDAGHQVYDCGDWRDLRTVWTRLRTDDSYNIRVAALVLAHKRSLLREQGLAEPSPADIMQAYNGTGPLSVRYRQVTQEYYLAFLAYHQAFT